MVEEMEVSGRNNMDNKQKRKDDMRRRLEITGLSAWKNSCKTQWSWKGKVGSIYCSYMGGSD